MFYRLIKCFFVAQKEPSPVCEKKGEFNSVLI